MPDFRVDVDAETADALQTECELLGFADPEAYLSWIVDNRAAIEQGTESARLLESYRERLQTLEARLDAADVDPERDDPGDRASAGADDERDEAGPSADAGPEAATATDGPATADDAATGDGSPAPDGSPAAEDTSSPDHATSADDADALEANDAVETAEGEATDRSGGADEPGDADVPGGVDDAPDPAHSAGPTPGPPEDPADGDPAPGRAASDGGTSVDDGITSMHLRPERVQRVSEDPVTEDAGVLADVATNRLDELSRRAVAETRERLDRDPETGLAYDSSTTMPGSTVRPGADVADLDSIEVPGRSAELVERRREVVGRALARLRDGGRARRSDFVEALYEEYPAGYETADGWWRCVRTGLDQVDAVDGGHVWEYEG